MELPAAAPAAPQRRFQPRSSGDSGTRKCGAWSGVRGQALGRGMPVGGFCGRNLGCSRRSFALLRGAVG